MPEEPKQEEIIIKPKVDRFPEFSDKYDIRTVSNSSGRGVIMVRKNIKPKINCPHAFNLQKLLNKLKCVHCGVTKVNVAHDNHSSF